MPSDRLTDLPTATIPAQEPQAPEALTPARRRDVPVALWPVVVVLYATLLPREMRISISSFDFFADRIGLIIVLPYVVRKLMDGAIRFVLPDLLLLLHSVWMIVSMVYHYGFSSGLERGGSLALDATVGYFLARISFRSLRDMRTVFILFAPGALLVSLSVALESITGKFIIGPLAVKIFGPLPYYLGSDISGALIEEKKYVRFGLLRGRGPFSHQIHAGVYLATLLPIYAMSGLRGWPRLAGLVAGTLSFFTVSSAAFLSMLMAFGLMIFDYVQRQVRELSWRLLVMVALLALVFLEVASNSGAVGIVTRYLTFDAQTAFFRQLIWQYAGAEALAHPYFGIGLADYEHPDWITTSSVDAHWLMLGLRFGLIAPFSLMLATIFSLIALSQASATATRADQRFYRGIAIALFIMSFDMFTVALWGGILNWYTILLGASVACAQRSYRKLV